MSSQAPTPSTVGARGGALGGSPLAARDLLAPGPLAELLGGTPPEGSPEAGTGVAYDSRKVRTGDVFFAWRGSSRHGIEMATEVLDKGATYIVSDVPHDRALLVPDTWAAMRRLASEARANLRSPVIGVTGSAGKTTVKTMLTAALRGRSTPGNLNTVPPLLAALVAAARGDAGLAVDAGDLVGELAPGAPLVVELGVDHPGEMELLTGFTRPDHGVITTIGESHLSRLGDVATVASEKSRLLSSVSGVRVTGVGAASRLSRQVLAGTHVVRVLGDGPVEELDGMPSGEVVGRLDGHVLRAMGHSFELPWPGLAMAENALLAIATAWLLGTDPEEAFERMARAPLEKGRLRVEQVGGRTLIDDSYNSNPLSAALALEVLRSHPAPRVAFLGDMRELGSVSGQRHHDLGAATTDIDMVVAIGDEAETVRSGNPEALAVADWRAAAALLSEVPEGATLLVKGSRSLELENLVAAIEERFGGAGEPAGTRSGEGRAGVGA